MPLESLRLVKRHPGVLCNQALGRHWSSFRSRAIRLNARVGAGAAARDVPATSA